MRNCTREGRGDNEFRAAGGEAIERCPECGIVSRGEAEGGNRAIVRIKRPVIILDEAMSGLEYSAEEEIIGKFGTRRVSLLLSRIE